MSELKAFNSERIYWAVEQVEREAGDIDNFHLDDNLFYIKSEVDAAIAELKAKLESVQASAYAESVDAGMENRMLKRALWLARAERAIAEAEYWYGHTSGMYYIDATEVPDEEDNPYRRVKDTTIGWYKTWMNVERKCRAKAEQYK